MNLFRNLKLTHKIGLLSISFLLFLLVLGVTSLKQVSLVNVGIRMLSESSLTPIVELEGIKSNVEYVRTKSSSLMDATDDSTRKTVKADLTTHMTAIEKALEKYKSDSQYAALFDNYNKFVKAEEAFIKAAEISNNVKQGPPTEVVNLDSAKVSLVTAFDDIINKRVEEGNSTYEQSKKIFGTTVITIVTLILISLVITTILSIIIIKETVIPVRKVTEKLKEISNSNGDLTQRIGYESKDEVGELSRNFDLFIEKLQSIIREVSTSAVTVKDLSENLNQATEVTTETLNGISDTITEIASSTSDGAASAEEINASLGEAAKFSEATSKASKNTLTNSIKAKQAAEDGAVKISDIVSSITDIADSSKEVSVVIKELNESSKKIGDIIKIITSISAQTNMLALNAAIEAARAGDAGKGFNVVADEIRKLADESNKAATEIASLVKENQLKSASAVNSVGSVEEKVSQGVTRASEVGESIQNIIKNVKDIVSQIEHIDEANEQQSQSTNEIEKAIATLASSSSQVAGGTENISASIEEQLSTMTEIERNTQNLASMAKKLSGITSGFRV